MRPFPSPQIVPPKRPHNHAQGAPRTVIVAVLCLGIGFGLGGLWHSRHGQRGGGYTEGANPAVANTEGAKPAVANTEAQALATPATVSPAAAAPPDPAIVAEVKRQIPNYASVTLEKGAQILREAALKDLEAALSQMEPQLKEAEQRVVRMEEAKSETGKQTALKDLQRLQAAQAAKLSEFTTRSSTQIEVLRQLKESAR